MKPNIPNSSFAGLVQRFFNNYLIGQRNLSLQTIASYRDTFRLLLRFQSQRYGKRSEDLTLADLDAPQILAFLDYLERERHNSVRSRNARLAALRTFLHYAALQEPISLPSIHRALAIPMKRFDQAAVDYLSPEEVAVLIRTPDSHTWSGLRDRTMFFMLYNTGARVSEIIGLNLSDLRLAETAAVTIHGKGRKNRVVPLWKTTKRQLLDWLRHIPKDPQTPLFPNRQGQRLTRSGVRVRLQAALRRVADDIPGFRRHRFSPHLLRHTTAMHLLQSGIDMNVIALWLGHENSATTHIYVEADINMKRRAIDKIHPPKSGRSRFRPGDRLLAFLDAL
jgi:site-specific recombinase XerD